MIKIDKSDQSCEDALKSTLSEIPYGTYALIFVDDRHMQTKSKKNLIKVFSSRKKPLIYSGIEETTELEKWLCEPQKREFDICIVGVQHQCNGIETELVIHVYPADCPLCQISNADPVIISRAKAMLVVATYQRIQCICGWKKSYTSCKDENTRDLENTILISTNSNSNDPLVEELQLNQIINSKYVNIYINLYVF